MKQLYWDNNICRKLPEKSMYWKYSIALWILYFVDIFVLVDFNWVIKKLFLIRIFIYELASMLIILKTNLFAFLKWIKLDKQSLFCESMPPHKKTSPFAWCFEIAAITAWFSWSLLILCILCSLIWLASWYSLIW